MPQKPGGTKGDLWDAERAEIKERFLKVNLAPLGAISGR